MGQFVMMRPVMAALVAACLLPAPTSLRSKEAAMHHAVGTFEVKLQPIGELGGSAEDGNALSRMSLEKTFSGGLQGKGVGDMLAARSVVPTSASYVAIERVTGTLDGRQGSFVLVHRGVMHEGEQQLEIRISPDSGSGALKGIAGSLSLRIEEGVHHYDLAYTLPDAG
jgi:hypothetical protein